MCKEEYKTIRGKKARLRFAGDHQAFGGVLSGQIFSPLDEGKGWLCIGVAASYSEGVLLEKRLLNFPKKV